MYAKKEPNPEAAEETWQCIVNEGGGSSLRKESRMET